MTDIIIIDSSYDREGSKYYNATLYGEPIDYAYSLDHLYTELRRNYPEANIEGVLP